MASSSALYTTHPRVIGKMNLTYTASISPSSVEHVCSLADRDVVFLSSHGPSSSHVVAVNTSSGHTRRLLTADKVGSIAFDPDTGNLFWVDVHKAAVMVHCTKTRKSMELLVSIDIPQSLLFVPEKNRLVIAHTASLVILYLPDKSLRHVAAPGLGEVSSMVYSAAQDRVFIGDQQNKQILELDLAQEKVAPFMSGLNQGVVSLAVEEAVLYWIEQYSPNLLWVTANNTVDVSWQDLGALTGISEDLQIASFKAATRPAVNAACQSANCSHVCFNEDQSGHVCKCPYGMELEANGATCHSTCAEDDSSFHCGEGACVPVSWVCDGTPDCDNGADEDNCQRGHRGLVLADEAPTTSTSPSTTSTTALPVPSSTVTTAGDVRETTENLETAIADLDAELESVTKDTSTAQPPTQVSTTTTTPTPSASTTLSTDTVTIAAADVPRNGSAFDSWKEIPTNPPPTQSIDGSSDPSVKSSTSSTKKNGLVALAVILALFGVIVLVVCFIKCRRSSKADFTLS